MKKAIVYASGTGSTARLAEEIKANIGECAYFGKPSDEALESDRIYVGFWTAKFTCTPEIKGFLEKLENKEVFLFGTAGYDWTKEYFDGILNSVAENLKPSNKVVGRFMCQGKVSDAKKKMLKEADAAKFEGMLPKLTRGDSHPDAEDLKELKEML